MYEISVVPGTGLGLIATSAIPRGTLIFTESPLFLLSLASLADETAPDMVEQLVNGLTEEDQRAYFSLQLRFIGEDMPAYRIFRTNYKMLHAPERPVPHLPEFIGMFLVCARLNHSCSPSACLSWNTTLSQQVVYAIKDIQPGEEITTTYLGSLLAPRDVRQRFLRQLHYFTCLCEACSVPDCSSSDARRFALGTCNDGSAAVHQPPAVQMGYIKRAFSLLREEGLGGLLPQNLYLQALGICAAQGDLARVSAFAVLAIDAMTICHGADSVAVMNIRPYVSHPETHTQVGQSRAWRTRAQDTKQKESPGFEQWLWRRAE
ncbi:hypothetical protein Q9L58_009203 [Maublancomyces gigas]|uniref:SET domain-containing protein n=1 Tax=Discina gigas TaxID=1032678 RepID=A0ABR3G7H8_9PEZI